MTVKGILTPVIKEEFQKYEKNGYKIKLKSTTKKRVKYTVFCALGAIIFWPAALIIYIVLMSKTNNVDTIFELAQKNPDMPIDQIIAQELKEK